jgi:hypothetical protein
MVINYINASTTAFAASSADELSSFDNNDDGVVSAGDVLMLINWFNVQAGVYSMSSPSSILTQSETTEHDDALLAVNEELDALWIDDSVALCE